mgnify:CR=1 FL=1
MLLVREREWRIEGEMASVSAFGETASPWGTVLPGPGGVPRRGKGRSVPHGERVID